MGVDVGCGCRLVAAVQFDIVFLPDVKIDPQTATFSIFNRDSSLPTTPCCHHAHHSNTV